MKREDVFERDDHTCVYCGERPVAGTLTVDHVEPRVRGGDNSRGNLVSACDRCNTEKRDLPAWAFLAHRPDLRAGFLRRATYVWPRLVREIRKAAPGSGGCGATGSSRPEPRSPTPRSRGRRPGPPAGLPLPP